MNALRAVVEHEVLATRRDRAPRALVAVFVGMTAVSAIIGWQTRRTVSGIYNQVVADGLTSQPNPFTGVSPLYYAGNTVIYVVMIGSLMAIALGVQTALRDRKANVAGLVLTRPISLRTLLAGRIAGVGAVLAAIVAISAIAGWVSIAVATGGPLGLVVTARLAGFAILTWVMLLGFAAVGMASGLLLRRETTALLVPFVVWASIAFVLPQLGTAARPIALLNPVAAIPQTGGVFGHIAVVTAPLSVTEQFKSAAAIVLGTAPSDTSGTAPFVVVGVFAALAIFAVVRVPRNRLEGVVSE